MHDYEKLGAFYLGREHDLDTGTTGSEPLLYDARDLTTHAVIIGMTGSGKTGLGIGLIEEAAIDRIPVIAIDPKGDLGNLLLTFPDLQSEDFRPWINLQDAAAKGVDPDEWATRQADTWREGLARWDQKPERIRRLRDAADFAIYTPGSTSGRPLALLRSFAAPSPALREDRDLYRDRIEATVTGLLGLLGVEADPLTSREHILLSTLVHEAWDRGADLDLAGLVGAIQQPPVTRVGVMDLETFYPAKDRFALAMKLNGLLAAPGFEAWLTGEPLSAASLFHTPEGKPRVTVISIAHLSDAERMFFVTLLVTEVIGWMRTQAGTGSLRALLYMDEVAGYLPPVANPPSKAGFLTLLKQARAYGLGLVLATQNPVDLDYKALSNAGTWFIGRLQTERDKARVMEGLEGATAGRSFDRNAMERVLAGVGARKFLLHNVHEDQPVIFETRWVMSYLAGPLTRDQIRSLVPPSNESHPGGPGTPATKERETVPPAGSRPVLPPGISEVFLPVLRGGPEGSRLLWNPRLLGMAEVSWRDARRKIDTSSRVIRVVAVGDGPLAVDWDRAEALDLSADEDLLTEPMTDGDFLEPPTIMHRAKQYDAWAKLYARWIRDTLPLVVWESPTVKVTSEPGESEGDFRIRLQQRFRETRDDAVDALRARFAPKDATLVDRIRRAEQAVAREQEQAQAQKFTTVIQAGTALLGAFLGRKRVSLGSASRVGTAMRGAGRMRKEGQDVSRAQENVAALVEQREELGRRLAEEIAALDTTRDAQSEKLTEVRIAPKAGDVTVRFMGLAWVPSWT